MNRESRNFLNEMNNLMERMDKHMTLSEANNINESLREAGVPKARQINTRVTVNVFKDPVQNQKKTRVTFYPVMQSDIRKVIAGCPEVEIRQFYKVKGADGKSKAFTLRGNINTPDKLPANAMQGDGYNVTGAMNPSDDGLWLCNGSGGENQNATWENMGQAKIKSGFYAEFTNSSLYRAKKRVKPNDTNTQDATSVEDTSVEGDNGSTNDVYDLLAANGITLEESFDHRMRRYMKQIIKESMFEDESEPASATDAAPQEHKQREDAEVKDWFQNVFTKIVSIISENSGAYTPSSLQEMNNWEHFYQLYLDSDFICANFRENMTSEGIIKAVLDALKTGNYDSIMSLMPTLDLQKLLYGSTLSPRNVMMLRMQAGGNNPSCVLGRTRFEKHFNKSVNPNATPYILTRPYANVGGTKGHGLAGVASNFGVTQQGRFAPYVAYDISDTSDIDPNNPYDFEAEPNMINNITGQMNQKYYDMVNNKPQETITPEEKEIMIDLESPEGRAKLYNESFVKYAEVQGFVESLGLTFAPVTTVSDYINNVINFWRGYVGQLPIDKEENKNSIIVVAAFAICLYTQCNDSDFKSVCYANRISASPNKDTQESDITQVVGVLEECINFMYSYWDNRFGPMRADIGAAEEEETEENVPTNNVVAESKSRKVRKVNRNNLEQLLNEFIR